MTVKIVSRSLVDDGVVDLTSPDAAFVLDCRLLPDPFGISVLSGQTGLDSDVVAWFQAHHATCGRLVDGMLDLAREIVRSAMSSGLETVEIDCVCLGGQHRSPYIAHRMATVIRAEFPVLVEETHLSLLRKR